MAKNKNRKNEGVQGEMNEKTLELRNLDRDIKRAQASKEKPDVIKKLADKRAKLEAEIIDLGKELRS